MAASLESDLRADIGASSKNSRRCDQTRIERYKARALATELAIDQALGMGSEIDLGSETDLGLVTASATVRASAMGLEIGQALETESLIDPELGMASAIVLAVGGRMVPRRNATCASW